MQPDTSDDDQDILSATAQIGDISVYIESPEGAFPQGTKANITALTSDQASKVSDSIREENSSETVNSSITGFDISFIYNEKEIQPADGKKVSVKFLTKDNDGIGHTLWHVDNSYKAEEVETIQTPDNGNISITADVSSFSIYALESYTEFTTYEFYDENGTIISDYTQIVKAGDTLLSPEIPDKGDHNIFTGWYIGTDKDHISDTKFDSFSSPVDGTKTINLNFHKF